MPISAPAVVWVVDTWPGRGRERGRGRGRGRMRVRGRRSAAQRCAGRAPAHACHAPPMQQAGLASRPGARLQLQGAGEDVPEGGGDHHAQHACGAVERVGRVKRRMGRQGRAGASEPPPPRGPNCRRSAGARSPRWSARAVQCGTGRAGPQPQGPAGAEGGAHRT